MFLLGAAAIIALFACYFLIRSQQDAPEKSSVPGFTQPVAEGRELMCLADSREEAQAIADSYGITLVDFSYGVAVFTTQESPSSVIARGEAQGLHPLSPNQIVTID